VEDLATVACRGRSLRRWSRKPVKNRTPGPRTGAKLVGWAENRSEKGNTAQTRANKPIDLLRTTPWPPPVPAGQSAPTRSGAALPRVALRPNRACTRAHAAVPNGVLTRVPVGALTVGQSPVATRPPHGILRTPSLPRLDADQAGVLRQGCRVGPSGPACVSLYSSRTCAFSVWTWVPLGHMTSSLGLIL
jgi:hypothetical protein